MNKKILWLFTIFLVGAVAIAEAQQPAKVPWVGYLASAGSGPSAVFMQGLRDLGYVEGKNIAFVFRRLKVRTNGIPILPSSWSVSTSISLWWGETRVSALPRKRPAQSPSL
jgi:hypothetical protein